MRPVLFVVFFLGFLIPCRAAEDYEQHVRNLAASTPIEQSEASLHAIELGGVDAFPALIAHFSDFTPVDERIAPIPPSTLPPDRPRPRDLRMNLGYLCFVILQEEVEGSRWLLSYRQYQVLTPDNAKQWLSARKGLTLLQLRQASLKESLRRAEADLAKTPDSELRQGAVNFLRKRLAAAK